MDYQSTYDELNIQIGDNSNITFLPEEKARALKKAWNDSFVVEVVWDSANIWASNTFSYPIPATMSSVKDIYTSYSANTGQYPISADLWEVSAGNIIFRTSAQGVFNQGNAITIKGNHKLDWQTDTLDDTNMQEYVLASAGFNTLSLLGYKKANLFLKNDLSMSELVTLRREFDAERKELRGKLLRETQGA